MMTLIRRLAARGRHSGAAALALLVFAAAAAPPSARADEETTLSAQTGERILEILEREAAGDWAEASRGYAELLDAQSLSSFERATLLKLQGRARYELDDVPGAIAAWRAALALGVLPVEDANALRVNTGQLLFAEGDYEGGVTLIEAALQLGTPLSSDLAMRLAQGYGQLERYRAGLDHARQAFDLAEPPERRHFTIVLFFYQQLDMLPEQAGLLARMVERWPGDKANWSSYAALLAQTGREADAFEINRIMYTNGMLDSSEELVRLARYYSYYEYPYGGAGLLERELNAGRVDPEPGNYQLLADLWRQAREWDRALPVLRRVATLTGAGPDYEKLGEALYQAGEYAEAEAVFSQALDRGGLSRPGDTWLLVGNTRVEQDNLDGASDAFRRALDWEYSRAGAQGWLDFIERKIAIQRDAVRLARLTAIEGCELTIERERRGPVTSPDQLDSEGRRILPLPPECEPFFDVYGQRRSEEEEPA